MAAIVVLALVIVPVGSAIVLGYRMNAESEKLQQDRLAVANAVETLMAEGYYDGKPVEGVTIEKKTLQTGYWDITVKCGEVEVSTSVKAVTP